VQLSFRYPNQQLLKPPRGIVLDITSYTREVLYLKDSDRRLLIIADGDALRFKTGYEVLKGGTKNGKEGFWYDGDKMFGPGADQMKDFFGGMGYESTLPEHAQIRTGKDINGIFLERISIELKPEQLFEIAKAHKIDLQLGNTKFGFTKNQMNTIRDFAKYITP